MGGEGKWGAPGTDPLRRGRKGDTRTRYPDLRKSTSEKSLDSVLLPERRRDSDPEH